MISLCFGSKKFNDLLFWRLLQIYNHLLPFSNQVLSLSLSLSLFLRNYRCGKALFNLTLPSELKWLRTPLQVLGFEYWLWSFGQFLIESLLSIRIWYLSCLLYCSEISYFGHFELVFQWKIVSLFLGIFYFTWFFFMGFGYAVFFLFLLFGASVCIFLELFLWDIFNVKFQFFTYL